MQYKDKFDYELILDLWNSCNNRCAFCYNQTLLHLPRDIKSHLSTCNDILNSVFIENFNLLRFLGGELFDGAIDKLDVRNEFNTLLESALSLIKNGQIKKLNLLTNLIYESRKDLEYTLQYFEKNGVIDHIDISSSYDVAGRFTEESEKYWWDNLLWIENNYPEMRIDVGMIITEPFIKQVTKEWLDDFFERGNGKINLNFNELDTALIKNTKFNSPYKHLFPKREDFIKFLKNLKSWGYLYILKEDPWNTVKSMQFVHVNEFSFPIYKNLSYLLVERKDSLQDGYIDSDIPLWDDIKKFVKLN